MTKTVEIATMCIVVTPYTGNGKEGYIDVVFSFIVSVAASVAAFYICKWLDSRLGDD